MNRILFFRIRNVAPIAILCALMCLESNGCGSKDSAADNADEWKRFTSDAGNFSALFPGTPREKIVPVQTALGESEAHNFVVEPDAQTAYGVNYNDYPAAVDVNHPQKLFDQCQASIVGEKGKIVVQQEMKVQNYPARELEFRAGGEANYSGRVRLILVGHRIYDLVAIFLTANPHASERQKFFDSFQLESKPK